LADKSIAKKVRAVFPTHFYLSKNCQFRNWGGRGWIGLLLQLFTACVLGIFTALSTGSFYFLAIALVMVLKPWGLGLNPEVC
jgi:hypothetical protein